MSGLSNLWSRENEGDVGAAAITAGTTLLLGESAVELHSESAEACVSDNKKSNKTCLSVAAAAGSLTGKRPLITDHWGRTRFESMGHGVYDGDDTSFESYTWSMSG
jgi:hypothetical protein